MSCNGYLVFSPLTFSCRLRLNVIHLCSISSSSSPLSSPFWLDDWDFLVFSFTSCLCAQWICLLPPRQILSGLHIYPPPRWQSSPSFMWFVGAPVVSSKMPTVTHHQSLRPQVSRTWGSLLFLSDLEQNPPREGLMTSVWYSDGATVDNDIRTLFSMCDI